MLMPTRRYKTDQAKLLAEGKIIVNSTDDAKFQHKVEMVNLVLAGITPSFLSEYSSDSKNAITLWVKKADENGFESLKTKKQTGRPPKLSPVDLDEIKSILMDDTPKDQGYNVWDGISLSDYILKIYSVELSVRQCQRLMHKLGFSLIRPQTFPSKGNEETPERNDFKKKLNELATNEEAIVVFQDEVHFQVTTSVTRKWAQKGSKPKILSAPAKKNVAYSGYVVPVTGELFVTKPGWFNYETVIQSFRDFLQLYSLPKGKKIYMILDNAPWHKKAKRLVQTEALEEYADVREKMVLVSLPPYSPDLNPIEQCWRITRREITHNTYFPTVNVLENTLDHYFALYRKPNIKFASLCNFKHKN
jgi:transposase